jgi:hypothetical protein
MWIAAAAGLSFFIVPPVVTAYNLGVMWYTGAGLETVYNDKVPTFAGLMYIFASIEVIVAVGTVVLLCIRWAWKAGNDALDKALYNLRKKRGFYSVDYVEPETPIRDFISDLYKRFKDKTCVMLEYQDEIDIRRRQKERHAAYMDFLKKQLADESDTSKPSKTTYKDDFDAD